MSDVFGNEHTVHSVRRWRDVRADGQANRVEITFAGNTKMDVMEGHLFSVQKVNTSKPSYYTSDMVVAVGFTAVAASIFWVSAINKFWGLQVLISGGCPL